MVSAHELCDVAVLTRTILRPSLLTAIRSIFRQDYSRPIQILIGVDAVEDGSGLIATLREECPPSMQLDVIDIGYSTSRKRGGLYPNACGGALLVLLAYAAHARHILFLDDDNWAAPDHVGALRASVEGFDWAFTLRWFVDGASGKTLCVDEWESVSPGRGVFAGRAGAYVDTNCLILNKITCHFAIPHLALAMTADGNGEDRVLSEYLLRNHSVGWTDRPTVYYAIRPDDRMYPMRRQWMALRGVMAP